MHTRKIIFVLLCIVIITCMAACSEETNIKSVKTKNVQSRNYLVICPFCRKKRRLKDFEDAAAPNMKLCPECGKRIPMPLLMRQTALKKR
jgi:uncharacterized CHY-type Zn-finger protein